MSISYTDLKGNHFFLDNDITCSLSEMERFDQIYSHKALDLMHQMGKSIFYCLKMIGKDRYLQGNYFLVQIEEEEKERIIQTFGDKFYIGIIHRPK